MIQIRKLVPLVLSFFLAGAVNAQTPITLQDALNYALNNSEVIKQARIDIENVKQKVIETRATALPQLNINSSVTGNMIVQQFVFPAEAMGGAPGEFIAIKAGQTWNAMSQVQFSQQIFNQQVFAGLKAAKGSVAFYQLAAQVSEENVMQQVAANFYQVLMTKEKIKVIHANLDRVQQLQKMIKGQLDNGLAKKIDLDRVLVNKGNLEAQKLELTNAVAQQENLLKYYMGMPIATEIVLTHTPLENLEIPRSAIANNDPLDVQNLVSLRLLDKQEELLGMQRKANIAESYPTLSLGANYTYNTQSAKFNLYSNNALNYDMSAVNLTLKIPVFDGFARKARRKQTEMELLKVREDKVKTNNGLQMNFDNAKKQITHSLEVIHAQKANKELAEEVFFSTKNNYKNGLANLTDLLNAESELVTAQNSFNEALLQFKIAEIELIKSKGNIKSLIQP